MPTKKTEQGGGKAATTKAAAKSPRKSTPKVNKVAAENGKVSEIPAQDSNNVKSGRKPPLNDKHRRFVDEYIIDLNATQAAIRAGYSEKTAGPQGFALLQKLEIQEYLAERRAALQQRTEITQEMVLQRWWEIATANPNELITYRRVCCRNCFGKDHQYQWVDESEWASAVRFAKMNAGDKPAELPGNEGGYGFDATLRPHPKCPECHGEGHGQVFAHDTRDASPAARALYAGVKQTKDGMEIKMRDQDAALANVARHLGMFKDTVKVQGDADNPLQMLMGQLAGRTLKPVAKLEEDGE
jgi:phage terminase small subunit